MQGDNNLAARRLRVESIKCERGDKAGLLCVWLLKLSNIMHEVAFHFWLDRIATFALLKVDETCSDKMLYPAQRKPRFGSNWAPLEQGFEID